MKITGFQGIKPRTSPRLIGDTDAQIAANTNLVSGELQPMSIPGAPYVTNTVGPLLALYKADSLWFCWARDVDVCRSPLPGPAKFIYSGDGEPRITTVALAQVGSGGDDYPATARALGVPKPQTVPTVTPSGGALADVTRFYCYTFYDDWDQESAISPIPTTAITGKPDGTWAITGMDEAPVSSGTGTVSVATGVTTFSNTASAKHWLRVGDEVVIATIKVAVSEIVSPHQFKVVGDFTGAVAWARKAAWGTCTKRLYRTSGTLAQFQLVAEGITVSGATAYNDTILDINIPGDELISASWELPPANMQGVFTLPSGALGGFSGNELCLSEPYQPHAWPPEYRMRSEYPIVAAGMFSSGVVLGTTGEPVVVLGHEPGQMMAQPAKGAYPCLSKRSMVAMGDSVGYATSHGFARIGDNGVDLLTVGNYTRDDWSRLAPATMVADTVRGRLYIMTRGQGTRMLIFDYLDGTGLTTSDIDATEIFADALSGKLYVSDADNMDVREFDPVDGVYMTQDWMSKEFVTPEPMNLGAARVNFVSRWSQATYDALLAAYQAAVVANAAVLAGVDVNGAMNDDAFNVLPVDGSLLTVVREPDLEAPGVTFTLYVDGVVVFSQLIPDNKGFRLPSGYKHDTFAVRVQGQSQVKSIDLAQTMNSLKNA